MEGLEQGNGPICLFLYNAQPGQRFWAEREKGDSVGSL